MEGGKAFHVNEFKVYQIYDIIKAENHNPKLTHPSKTHILSLRVDFLIDVLV